jgi:hypothetical protein
MLKIYSNGVKAAGISLVHCVWIQSKVAAPRESVGVLKHHFLHSQRAHFLIDLYLFVYSTQRPSTLPTFNPPQCFAAYMRKRCLLLIGNCGTRVRTLANQSRLTSTMLWGANVIANFAWMELREIREERIIASSVS